MQRAPCGLEHTIPGVSRGPTLGEQVYTYIRQRIVNGFYQPGQTIVESELAAALKVSRTPVSNAVIMLRERGLIDERNGRFITLDLTISDVIRNPETTKNTSTPMNPPETPSSAW